MRKYVFVFSLLLSAMLSAQTPKLTMDDLLGAGGFRGRGGGPQQTPDGKYTVMLERGQIALKPAGGGEEKMLTSSDSPASEMELSPDGLAVAYVCKGNVWVAPVAGGEPMQLTHDPAGPGDPRGATDHRPQWNPKGKWILYESGQKGFNELYVVSEDGKAHNLIAATELYYGKDVIANPAPDKGDAVASDRFDARPAWAPDGTRISYTQRSREFFSGKLEILSFDQKTGSPSGEPMAIYTAKNDPGGAWAINTDTWSPDSSTLAVVLQETHWDKIWLIPSAGGKPKELTFGTGEDEEPIYSPDGKWIAFESNRDLPEERHIWLVPSAGGAPHRLTALTGGSEMGMRWDSDGKSIHFEWRSTLGATAAYVADAGGSGAPRMIGAMHHSKFEDLGIMPEVIRYKSGDGMEIASILYKPVGFQPGTRYPTVVEAHGGPEGQTQLSAAPWAMFLAERGYVVVDPNFRGSTGYGERFRNSNVEDSGGGEIDDIAATVKYLVDKGMTDPKRVAISGGSHGGTVVANAVVRYPDMFAAGIEMFGVVDRALFLRYTNRNSEIRWETKMGGTPEQKPAVYRKCNVLLQTDKIKTPLLILHGEQDPQVPPQESQELAAALKKAGKTYLYFTYPGEGHGFQQRAHRQDSYERQLAFLEKYLKPSAAQ